MISLEFMSTSVHYNKQACEIAKSALAHEYWADDS